MVTEAFSGIDYGLDVEMEEFNLPFSTDWLLRWSDKHDLGLRDLVKQNFQELTTLADESGAELKGTDHTSEQILDEIRFAVRRAVEGGDDERLPSPDEVIAWIKRIDWLLGCLVSQEN